MTRERQEALTSYENKHHKLHLTGHVGLDAILVYMKQKAETNHTVLECRHTQESIDYMLTKISEDDLTHLLSDLIENAIIALSGTKNGRLQITFGKLQKEAYLSIADNGIPFELETLHSFGRTPHTTHADSGGSGIGLMDIWRIKRKYRATIQIQEYQPGTTSFSKRILFSFNSKNHYVIQSFRHTELINTQTRGDLYVIPAETNEKNEDKQHEQNTETLNS
jgi:C4-dicarboxylate-specific signal transduction histidine kinase